MILKRLKEATGSRHTALESGLPLLDADMTRTRYLQFLRLPALASQGQLLGCLYVIKGATLGGQIITRSLEANLGLTPLTGASFFDGYGARTGSHWKAFCAMLRANADESGPQDDILASANPTFETLGQWLFPPYPTPRVGTP